MATLVLHLIVLLVLHETYISYPVYENQLDVAMYDFREESPTQEELLINPEDRSSYNPTDVKNVSADANLEKTTYTAASNGFNKSKVEEQVWKELRDLESKEYEQAKKERGETGKENQEDEGEKNNEKPIDKNLIKPGEKENENAGYGKEVAATATLDLKGRYALALGKPAYKCKVEGVVTVTIKVNRKGEIISAEIDESRTNTQNECLRNEALKYARDKIKTRINQNFEADASQTGSIIYRYIGHR